MTNDQVWTAVATAVVEAMPLPVILLAERGEVLASSPSMRDLGDSQTLFEQAFVAAQGGSPDETPFVLSSLSIGDCRFLLAGIRDPRPHAEMIAALEAANKTDGLTGLYNKAAFHGLLESVVDHAKADRTVIFSLMMIDMDGFKLINDREGHLAGDAALVDFAGVLRGSTRHTDSVCRVGGDEFAVIVRGDQEDAQRIAERLEKRHTFEYDGKTLEYGCSVGVFEFDAKDSAADLIAKADAAMYERKRDKKSRIRLVSPTQSERQSAAELLARVQSGMFPASKPIVPVEPSNE